MPTFVFSFLLFGLFRKARQLFVILSVSEESRRRLAFKINAQTDVALKDGVSRALQDKRLFFRVS